VLLRSGSEAWAVTLEATAARHLNVTSERGTLRLERVDLPR
jgi:hypothetical protein